MRRKNEIFLYLYFCLPTLYAQVPTQTDTVQAQDIIRLSEMRRIGAVCKDGSRSNSIGVGACSTHGGVDYWLYTEAPVYQQYSANLPAVPPHKILPLRPEEVHNVIEWGRRLLTPPFEELYKRRKNIGSDTKNPKARPEATQEEKPIRKKSARTQWDVLDFLMPFILFTMVICMFVILYVIIRKVL